MSAYEESARVYDLLYSGKDYAGEAQLVRGLVEQHSARPAETLLDVGCGTGSHLVYLAPYFRVAGLEGSPAMLERARLKLPGIELRQGDMADFDFGQIFDVVVSLFSGIGYMRTPDAMRQAVAVMARHVAPGGLLMVEPWLRPADARSSYLTTQTAESADMQVARMSISRVVDGVSVIDMHHLVGTADGVHSFVERHELGLFTHEAYLAAVEAAGLEPVYDEHGLTGRGLYIGKQPG